jgi:hypothetical protein
MTKRELIGEIAAARGGLLQRESAVLVNAVFDSLRQDRPTDVQALDGARIGDPTAFATSLK